MGSHSRGCSLKTKQCRNESSKYDSSQMCVEGESPTTNNFLNTKAKALSCNEFNEPKGSLSIPYALRHPNARKRAQHVKGVTKDDVKTQGKNAEIFVSGKEERSGSPETYSRTSRSGSEALTQHDAKRSSFHGEFDPGSGRTLAACLTHASRTELFISVDSLVANG